MDKVDTKTPELLWRRLSEPMADWVIFVPLLFALGVVGLLFLYRKENRGTFLIIAGSVVAVFAAVYLPLAFLLKDATFPSGGKMGWIVVLAPILLVALVYVSLMYVKDSRSIHPVWAGFLGLLRCCVYGILTVVFLLPGCQGFDTSSTPSKIIFVVDVSRSMDSQDRLPEPGVKGPEGWTRKQEFVNLLMKPLGIKGREKANIFQLILEKTPVTLYRGGGKLDERDVIHFKSYEDVVAFTTPSKDGVSKMDEWLNPDPLKVPDPVAKDDKGMTKEQREAAKVAFEKAQAEVLARRSDLDQMLNGTNIYGVLDRVSKLEAGNYIQAIVVFSDGHSNSGSEDSLREFYARVQKPSPPINVFTIGIGENRKKYKIEIQDLLVPTDLRPEDKFPIRVNVIGENLEDTPTSVEVTLQQIKDKDKRPITGKIHPLEVKKGVFKGSGDFPRVQFEYDDLDLKKLSGVKGTDEASLEPLMGTWKITARVPKNDKERFTEKFHELTTEFQVYGKKLRVLLVSSGPLRDYQFVRTLFYRESLEKRLEFCVYLQNAAGSDHVDQDVEPERLLAKFPDRLGAPTKEEPFSTLSAFDVIIGFDPDWTALAPKQLQLIKQWVGNEGGGLVFIAGPINTYQLSLKDADDSRGLLSMKTICPVFVQDNRLIGALEKGHDSSRPHKIQFTKEAKDSSDFEFLRLDVDQPGPTAGWDMFFWGGDKDTKESLKRGFYWYYPVEGIKPGAKVLATFDGPPESRIKINEKDSDPPFIATMKYGNGKTVYLGSAETWRLRQAKEIFHDRFWTQLGRYASSGITQRKQYGRILMADKATAGKVMLEAEVKGEDLLPLKKATVKIEVKKLDKFGDPRPVQFELRAKDLKRADLAGWFEGTVELPDEGEYMLKIPIGAVADPPSHLVREKKPNLEKDKVRTNFEALKKIASEATHVLNELEGGVYARVKNRFEASGGGTKGSASERLFLPLNQADILYECIRKVPPRETTVKGSVDDIWDDGWKSGWEVRSDLLAILLPVAVGLLGFAILATTGGWLGGLMFLGGFVFVGLIVLLARVISGVDWPMLDVDFSFVLIGTVSLLAVEWLTRKLLRLA